MGMFSTRNSDGASALAESSNNISKAKWQAIQDRAAKANPELADTFSAKATARRLAAAEQHRKRDQS